MNRSVVVPLLLATFSSSGSAQKVIHEWTKPADDFFGVAVTGVGDLNNDGFDDVAASAPAWIALDTGSVDIYSGQDGSLLYAVEGIFGFGDGGLDGIGDLNGDGTPDFLVGNLTLADLTVHSGVDGSVLDTIDFDPGGFTPPSGFPADLAAIGDVNGDGVEDFAGGATEPQGCHAGSCPAGKGRVYVFSGVDRSVLFSREGEITEDHYGWAVDGAGDVNNDSVPDVIVSTLPRFQAPFVEVISGIDGSLIHHLEGADGFGLQVAGLGDLNGDGHSEFAISQPDDSTVASRAGAVWVYSGIDATVLYSFFGKTADEQLGTVIANAGDISGDGLNDLIIDTGTFYARGPTSSYEKRRTLLVSGKTGSILAQIRDGSPGDRYRHSVAAAGDVNGDGIGDLIRANTRNGDASGQVAVHAGSPLYIQVNGNDFFAGDQVNLTVLEGAPGTPCLLAVIELNGTPTFLSKGVTLLNAAGRRKESLQVTPAFAGIVEVYQAYGINALGQAVTSHLETITFDAPVHLPGPQPDLR